MKLLINIIEVEWGDKQAWYAFFVCVFAFYTKHYAGNAKIDFTSQSTCCLISQ
jgi:hypothetical protein